MNYLSEKIYRRAIQLLCGHIYLNPDPDIHKSILVAGTARSGTVWLGDMISSQLPCRLMFEPFNPELVPGYRDFHYFQYMRPAEDNQELYQFASNVFTGMIRNSWIDHRNERIWSQYRLIKEIRANLLLKWLHDRFPQVPIIFLIRHPCAVVLSRMQLKWATDRDIASFLAQPDLITDYLGDYVDLIKAAKTDEEKHAIIWCVSNLVPLKQLITADRKLIYYENLCLQPDVELPAIFEALGQEYQGSRTNQIINRPSQTAQETSPVVIGTDKVSHWKQKLNPSQIKNILRIVNAFGLGHLYGDSVLPLNNDVA